MTSIAARIARHPVLLPLTGFTLACVWPGAQFLARNAGEVQRMGIATVVVVASISAALWLAGIALATVPALVSSTWSIPRAFCAGIVGVFVLFTHQVIRARVENVISVPGISGIVFVIILTASLVLAWRLARFEPVRTGLVVAAALLAIVPAARLLPVAMAGLRPESSDAASASRANEPVRRFRGENVYYVILDGYEGRAGLQRHVAYDNDPFLRQMRGLGFVAVDSARSNYMTTQVSVAALLEGDYVVTEATPRYRDNRRFYPHVLQQGPAPREVRDLYAAGYDFFWIGNAGIPCSQRPGVKCLDSASRHGFFNNVASAFLAPTEIPGFARRLAGFGGYRYDALRPLSEALPNLIAQQRPVFVFAHHMSPHPPYRRTDCSEQPGGDDLVDWGGDTGRRQYVETIECLNREVLALTRRIDSLDPGAIVVFQADHGSSFAVDWMAPMDGWSDESLDERTSFLNLVRLPEHCRQWIRPTLAQINTMRLVLGCLERRTPTFVPERTYLTQYAKHPDFGRSLDVTARLGVTGRGQTAP